MKMTMGSIVLGCSVVLGTAAHAQSDMDKQFLMTASQSDYTEITFSKLAVDKSTNPTVKAYAQKMIDDHTTLESEMKPFADKLGVTPVMQLDSDHQMKYDNLSKLSSMDFDKTYMQAMDDDHHKALTLFKQEEASAADPAMKKTVEKGEKVVAMHTKMADMDVKKMNKPVSMMQ